MKQANIDLKVTGVRGGSPNYQENKGAITVFVDSEMGKDRYIHIDAFEGQGEAYKRRAQSLIQIKDQYGRMWHGSIDELTTILLG